MSIFLHEVFHQLGDFSIMLHRKHSLEYTLFSQVFTGAFAILGGYIAIHIGEEHDAYLNLFVTVSFCYVIFAQILPELISSKFTWKGLLLETLAIAAGFMIAH